MWGPLHQIFIIIIWRDWLRRAVVRCHWCIPNAAASSSTSWLLLQSRIPIQFPSCPSAHQRRKFTSLIEAKKQCDLNRRRRRKSCQSMIMVPTYKSAQNVRKQLLTKCFYFILAEGWKFEKDLSLLVALPTRVTKPYKVLWSQFMTLELCWLENCLVYDAT